MHEKVLYLSRKYCDIFVFYKTCSNKGDGLKMNATCSRQGNKRKFFALVLCIVLVFSLIGGMTITSASSGTIAQDTERTVTLPCGYANLGSGINQFSYDSGQSTILYGKQTVGWTMFRDDNIYADNGTPGAFIKYKFQGSHVELNAERSRSCGTVDISILDENDQPVGSKTEVDLYANQSSTYQKVYEQTFAQEGVYTILIKITDKVNPNNSPKEVIGGQTLPKYWTVNIAGISILTTAPEPTPTPVPTPTPTLRPLPTPTDHPITKRQFRVATTNVKIRQGTIDHNLPEIIKLVDKASTCNPDIIVLSESIYTRGTSTLSETVPGPYFDAMEAKAKQYNCYIAFNVNELRGDKSYNTDFLLDRNGILVGKYDKVKVPAAEISSGLSPGNTFPVFKTEFGYLGMEVCWDIDPINNAEVTTNLVANGAEAILVSSVGDYTYSAAAQAAQFGKWFVVAGQDKYQLDSYHASAIINPSGVEVAGITDQSSILNYYNSETDGSYAFYDINLGDEIPTPIPTPTQTPVPTPTPTPTKAPTPASTRTPTPTLTPTPTPTQTPTLTPTPTQTPTPTLTPLPTSTFTPTPTPIVVPSFTDIDGTWAAEYIINLAGKRIVSGYETSPGVFEFRPSLPIQRQEFAKIITVAFDIYNPSSTSTFSDCPAGAWFTPYVGSLQNEGITNGMGKGKFGVGRNVSRQDTATMLSRAMVKYQSAILPTSDQADAILAAFPDGNTIASYAKIPSAYCVDAKLIDAIYAFYNSVNLLEASVPDNGSYFLPKENMTRAEMSKVFSLALTDK
jgi:predicted amidohydrolase